MILAAYPENIRLFYQSEILTNNKYLFSRYIKKIKEKDLKNPALAYAYALHLDEKIDRFSYEKEEINFKPEALNYLKQSSDEGYIQATIDLLSIYTRDEFFEMSNCEMITKKNNFFSRKRFYSKLGD